MSQSQFQKEIRRGWRTAAGFAFFLALAIQPAVQGATDSNLFIQTIKFTQYWSKTNADTFSISGQINPRGATNNLSAATLAIQFLSEFGPATLGAPVPLDASGQGSLSTNGMRMTASFNGYSGQYGFTISGATLQNYTQVPNVTGLGTLEPTIALDIEGASLANATPTNTVLMPDATLSNQTTRGLFIYREHLCGPLFESLKTTAAQFGTNFVLGFNGVAVPDFLITTNTPITITISNAVITIPADLVAVKNRGTYLPDLTISTNQGIVVRSGPVAGLSKFSISTSQRTFLLKTTAIPGTGIPLAGNGAPTIYELPLQIDIPTGDIFTQTETDVTTGTNLYIITDITNTFSTIIELTRTNSTSTKWAR